MWLQKYHFKCKNKPKIQYNYSNNKYIPEFLMAYLLLLMVNSCWNLLYKAEKPSVCVSVCWFICIFDTDNSAVPISIETTLAQNENCVVEDHRVYFYKPIKPIIH